MLDRTWNRIAPLLCCAVLAAAGLSGCSQEAAKRGPVVRVQVAPAKRTTIERVVQAEAVLYPIREAAITPKISAPVSKFLVQRGDKVHRGQLLAVLENRDLAAASTENEGAYDQAQATYETAVKANLPEEWRKAELDVQAAKESLDATRKMYVSRQDLYRQGALPRKDLDQAEVAYVQAQNQYDIAQKHLQALQAGGKRQALKAAQGQFLTNFIIARPRARLETRAKRPSVSVIIPARNEEGNIADIFARTPEMGEGTELVFVEGHSRDDTYTVIEKAIAAHPERRCQLLQQTGIGKGDAVRLGFAHAKSDILMILDADLTVPPEDLPRFYEALCSSKGEFINGVRLVYPMEKQAMRFLNLAGNKFFTLAFSWLLGQPIKDTLCGTKVLWKTDYEAIAANRAYFGEFDPFGDFDLIFGAVKLNLKLIDLPIRYRERTYGSTNINRWTHGWLLLKMVAFAAKRLKFV